MKRERQRAYLHYDVHKPHQIAAMNALSLGLRAHGIWSTVGCDWPPLHAQFFVSWGDRVQHWTADTPRLFLEAGHFNGSKGDYKERRLTYISTSWDRMHGIATINPEQAPADRFDRIGPQLQPWKFDDGHALILEQLENDAMAPSVEAWRSIKNCILDKHKNCVVRAHPLTPKRVQPSLSEDLAGARMAFTYSSTAAVEAVCAGVPTVALSQACIAWPVTGHSIINAPFIGAREQWAYNLAYRNWTLGELESGEAWEHLRYRLETEANECSSTN